MRNNHIPYGVKMDSSDISPPHPHREHVNEDYKPFVCISEQCSQPPRFASSLQWFEHMFTSHGQNWPSEVHMPSSWVCPSCFGEEEITFSKPAELTHHFTVLHNGIFTDSQAQAIVRLSQVRSPRPETHARFAATR